MYKYIPYIAWSEMLAENYVIETDENKKTQFRRMQIKENEIKNSLH